MRQQGEGRLLEARVELSAEQRRHERGVGGVAATQLAERVAELAVDLLELLAQLGGVDEVAVVRERHRARLGVTERRLRVLPGGTTRRRVPAVADREVAAQGGEARLVEHLGDEAHVLVDEQALAVARRDTCRLLAAVLQRVQAVVGEFRDLFTRRPDPEDATCVLGALLAGKDVV